MVNKYYQKRKGKLQKEPRKRYQNLSEEEKDKKRQKAREGYQSFAEEKKDKWRRRKKGIKVLPKKKKKKGISII